VKHAVLYGLVAMLLLTGSAYAGLVTDSFDDVETEVIARDAALVGDLDKTQKKEKKTLTSVLKTFAKESKGRKTDAKLIKKIVGKLAKQYAADQAMNDLLNTACQAFLDEVDGGLDNCEEGDKYLGDENKKKKAATKKMTQAGEAGDAAEAEADLKKKAALMKKFESKVAQAEKATDKAIDNQEGLTAHEQEFLKPGTGGYKNASSCTKCHPDAGSEMLASAHWTWEGTASKAEGHETHTHGKNDLINNFCIAIPSNEGRCTQCHAGVGYKDKTFDFDNMDAMDCLICHDTTDTYRKDLKTAGAPVPGIDLKNVAMNVGEPSRNNCGLCHYFAGGGDNVKHGDLSSLMNAPTREMDVHMAIDGRNMACQECHTVTNHQTKGMGLHSTDAGPVECTDCHDTQDLTGMQHAATHLDKVSCQMCHIPTFARGMPTKIFWDWSTAGQDITPKLDQYGKPDYDKKKGNFIWGMEVLPAAKWFNGKWKRLFLNEAYTYEYDGDGNIIIAEPVGNKDDANAKIYPFKEMKGVQASDSENDFLIVPHLFGKGPGPNPFWGAFNWDLALAEGAAYAGQNYSGSYEWVKTVMYLSINHEIAPKEQARQCVSCHGNVSGTLDWKALGYEASPYVIDENN
jgi:octaheme c-type cytochrome (tetrathionate reductase family)